MSITELSRVKGQPAWRTCATADAGISEIHVIIIVCFNKQRFTYARQSQTLSGNLKRTLFTPLDDVFCLRVIILWRRGRVQYARWRFSIKDFFFSFLYLFLQVHMTCHARATLPRSPEQNAERVNRSTTSNRISFPQQLTNPVSFASSLL